MMHLLAQTAARDLAAQGAPLDPIEDFDDLVELNRLALACENASSAWKTQHAFFPTVGAANVTLRRLSIGARIFFAEEVAPHIADDDCSQVAALAWIMAHSDRPDLHLWPLAGRPAQIQASIEAWMKTVGATWQELDRAVAQLLKVSEGVVLDKPGKPAAPPPPPDYCAICSALAEAHGRDPVWWFWEAPEALVDEMLDAMDRRNDIVEQRQRASVVSAGQPLPAVDPKSRFYRTRRALQDFKAAILKRKKGIAS